MFLFFFTLNSNLNSIKVAFGGIAPVSDITDQTKTNIVKANSTPVYIFDNNNNNLINICSSAVQLKRDVK